MNKRDIINLVFGEDAKHIDVSVNQIWAKKMKELGVNPEFFVWSYKNNIVYGEPVNLLEEYAKQIIAEIERQVSQKA